MHPDPAPVPGAAEAPPPILGSWQRMYALVLITLLAVVILLTVLTQVYA
jgi:hypothetical protein